MTPQDSDVTGLQCDLNMEIFKAYQVILACSQDWDWALRRSYLQDPSEGAASPLIPGNAPADGAAGCINPGDVAEVRGLQMPDPWITNHFVFWDS